jgi:hypothetical protein
MDPKSFSDYYKKYGSGFLLWCAIFFLYTELSSYKEKVVKIEEKLYDCLQRSAYANEGTETEKESQEATKIYAIKTEEYDIKREMVSENS